MTLDSWLVARQSKELDALLRGARIQAVSASAGEFAIFCYRRGEALALHAVVDSNAPLVAAYEHGGSQKENSAVGWAGAVAALLKGCIIDAVHVVLNDRVLYVDVSSRSAFGVPSRSRIVFELQPRKANALVLRHGLGDEWIIVAAAKQFEGAGDSRNVITGAQYEPPPAREARLDRVRFLLAADDVDDADSDRLRKLLGDFDPACTPPLAREVVFRSAQDEQATSRGRRLLAAWAALAGELEAAAAQLGDVFVYRKGDDISLFHIVRLGWPGVEPTTAASVNELCASALQNRPQARQGPAILALRKKLATMLERGKEEAASLEQARAAASAADALRHAGEAIYSNLAEIGHAAVEYTTGEGMRVVLDPLMSAKENAAAYFRRYKKARSGLPRIETRLREVTLNREYWEQLSWELERAQELPLVEREIVAAEVADALGIRSRRKKAPRARSEERKVALSGGALAYVGRSPKENERLTFSVAGPDDFWFHARGIPGAHVIVKTGGAEISPQQIEEAAALAARSSRASNSTGVEVDFTRRKHVRRHASRRPGLVWYTDFSTIRVTPKP